MYISSDQVGFTGNNGTSYDIAGTWMEHSGLGVNIGVIDGGMYDVNAELLKGVSNVEYLTFENNEPYIPTDVNDAKHSTFVISMIKGKYYKNTYEVDYVEYDEVYEGHARGAKIYATDIDSMEGYQNIFDAFVENDVHVVNFSMGYYYDDENVDLNSLYISYDKEFDRLIKNTGICVVVSAGNSQYNDDGDKIGSYISSPGKSLNSITVGAGFINAPKAMTYIYDSDHYAISSNPILTNGVYTSQSLYLQKGQKIRAIMVFDKRNNENITSYEKMDDLDLSLIDNLDTVIVSNPSERNNTEVVEYEIKNTGYYRFKVEAKQIVDINNIPNFNIIYHID